MHGVCNIYGDRFMRRRYGPGAFDPRKKKSVAVSASWLVPYAIVFVFIQVLYYTDNDTT